jgi:uncharacterized protein with PQ loop repeat
VIFGIAQLALRIDAKTLKLRRENGSVIRLMWLDFLSVIRYPFTLGIAPWLLHRLIRNDIVIIVANVITFSLSLAILVLNIRFDGWR